MDIKEKTLIILPHLDDEFALVPLIKKITKDNSNNLKIMYCAERTCDSEKKRKARRSENITSLELLGCKKENIKYLNDYFEVQDLRLWNSAQNIYNFIGKIHSEENFGQIICLSFEGGHPDHDSLALIVNKFSKACKINTFYVPAYNYRNTLFIPISVFRPLQSQESYFNSNKYNLFCWIDCLKIAYIYKTERKAFIKLFPFILFQSIFSQKMYLTQIFNIGSVKWIESLSYKRYKVTKEEIFKAMNW
tara:strand:- start:513 stop:1256 length:744 start_codon:yes stop_codon:yes gene_type:complete